MVVQLPLRRTVTVRFPNGETQYWLTDRDFSEGETVVASGSRWTVTEVTLPAFRETHLTVRVREAE